MPSVKTIMCLKTLSVATAAWFETPAPLIVILLASSAAITFEMLQNLLRRSQNIRARPTRTQHDLETDSLGHTKRRVLVVVGERVGIRTHRFGSFGVVVRRALARAVVLPRAAVRGLVVLGASREARVERGPLHVAVWVRVNAVAGALRWRDL
jgi:hypothetical protein